MRAVLLLALGCVLAGCGSGKSAHSAAFTRGSITDARRCLTAAGVSVTGGPRAPGDTNAPDYELVVGAAGHGAFVAFYDDLARAQHYEPQIRKNAGRFHGSVERRGHVAIVWTAPPPRSLRARVERCVF